jgi:hypothetical protein
MVEGPLREGGGIDLNDTVFDKSFGSDEFVVGSVVYDIDDSGFSGGGF